MSTASLPAALSPHIPCEPRPSNLPSTFSCPADTYCLFHQVPPSNWALTCCPAQGLCGVTGAIFCNLTEVDPDKTKSGWFLYKTNKLDAPLDPCGRFCCPRGYLCQEQAVAGSDISAPVCVARLAELVYFGTTSTPLPVRTADSGGRPAVRIDTKALHLTAAPTVDATGGLTTPGAGSTAAAVSPAGGTAGVGDDQLEGGQANSSGCERNPNSPSPALIAGVAIPSISAVLLLATLIFVTRRSWRQAAATAAAGPLPSILRGKFSRGGGSANPTAAAAPETTTGDGGGSAPTDKSAMTTGVTTIPAHVAELEAHHGKSELDTQHRTGELSATEAAPSTDFFSETINSLLAVLPRPPSTRPESVVVSPDLGSPARRSQMAWLRW